jgi:hypothetical protein
VCRTVAFLALAAACSALACRQVAGIEDITSARADAAADAAVTADAGTCGCPGCTTLASGLKLPLSIVLADGYVYFLNYGPADGMGSLMRVPTAGGKGAETVLGNLTRPFSLAADATNLYWQAEDDAGGVIVQRPISGGATLTLASGLPTLQDLLVKGIVSIPTTNDIALSVQDVYFLGFVPGKVDYASASQVLRVPIGGGAVTTLVSQWPDDGGPPDGGPTYWLDPIAIVADGASLYMTTIFTQIGLLKVPLSGGVTDVLVPDLLSPYCLALAGDAVLFGDDGSNGSNGTVQTVSASGGSTSIVTKGVTPLGMVTSEGVVYFLDLHLALPGSPTSIDSLSLTTKEVVTLAQGLAEPVAIAVDSKSVYWSDAKCGTVMRIPR